MPYAGGWRPVPTVVGGLRHLRLGLSDIRELALALPDLRHLDLNGCSDLRVLELRCPRLLSAMFQAVSRCAHVEMVGHFCMEINA